MSLRKQNTYITNKLFGQQYYLNLCERLEFDSTRRQNTQGDKTV